MLPPGLEPFIMLHFKQLQMLTLQSLIKKNQCKTEKPSGLLKGLNFVVVVESSYSIVANNSFIDDG